MKDRILFEERHVTDAGNITWGDGFTAWGEVQRISETSARFYIRYRSDITPSSHRIVHFGAIWLIASAVPDHKRTMLTIDSDFSSLVEVTHLESTEREFLDAVPIVRPPS